MTGSGFVVLAALGTLGAVNGRGSSMSRSRSSSKSFSSKYTALWSEPSEDSPLLAISTFRLTPTDCGGGGFEGTIVFARRKFDWRGLALPPAAGWSLTAFLNIVVSSDARDADEYADEFFGVLAQLRTTVRISSEDRALAGNMHGNTPLAKGGDGFPYRPRSDFLTRSTRLSVR